MDLNMKVVKKTDEYRVLQKRSGRYAIRTVMGEWVNGSEKIKILIEAGLIKAALPQEPEDDPSSEKSEETIADEPDTAEEQSDTEPESPAE